ncbi:zinc finger FYVE domain-containing protein 26 isoform X2 [Latimeria chalumnae]|uniref:zinc finger FYVE domain-containing protein 26 isoform X2 n=1 Tax=Latimeria chalumnae TaxID=7897 RepID=UPI0003C116E4|nr:PREDICTED: zinc finger FYVE domain-containing protein 26 isoform X2 [Latimeria chalumnae]|eukprot:XP_005991562.1 PREDICTED: zinc finger FYVE domain-containing protein 26 isoform X2 [Latimeria chalumnae]
MHPFGHEKEASVEKLFEFFCERIQHEDWDLAQACIPQLHQQPLGGDERVKEILQAIVEWPYQLSSSMGFSPHRLAWLWLLVLEQWLTQDQKPLPAFLRSKIEFMLLLEELPDEVSDDVIKELHRAFLHSHGPEGSDERKREHCPEGLDSWVISTLRNLLFQNPQLVRALVGYLLVGSNQGAAAEYNYPLHTLFINFLLDTLHSLKTAKETQGSLSESTPSPHVETVYSVVSVLHCSAELQMEKLRQLCEELFDACDGEGSPLNEERLMGCMLRKNDHFLVSLYGNVATERRKEKILGQLAAERVCVDLPEAEQMMIALFSDPDRTLAWKNAYFYCQSSNKHFLEQALITALSLLKREDFPTLNNFLQQEFKPLARLVVLLGWTQCQSLESAQTLLCSLHENMELYGDSVLKDYCDALSAQVEVVEWCLKQNSDCVSDKDLLQLLHSLDCHSVLYSLHHLSHLPALNEDEVIELLQKVPGGCKEGGGSSRRLESNNLICQRNVMLFQAFCAMKYAIYALCVNEHERFQCGDCLFTLLTGVPEDRNSNREAAKDLLHRLGSSGSFEQYFTKCQQFLQRLPAPVHLELLENLFSLLFLSYSDLNTTVSKPQEYRPEEREEEDQTPEVAMNLDSRLEKMECPANPRATEGPKNKMEVDSVASKASGGPPATQHKNRAVFESQCKENCTTAQNLGCSHQKSIAGGRNGFLADEVALDAFLEMLADHLENMKGSIHWMVGHAPKEEVDLVECMNCSVSVDSYSSRVLQLSRYVSEAQWRLKVVMSNKTPEGKLAATKTWPWVQPKCSSLKRRSRKRKSRAVTVFKEGMNQRSVEGMSGDHSTSASDGSASSFPGKIGLESKPWSQQHNLLIPMMLSPPESLLISCILRGNFIEAHQVVLMFNLESSPCFGELVFMERYQEVIRELAQVEQKIENQTVDNSNRKSGNGCSTLQAIGNAAAAGMVFYSISDVADKLLQLSEGPGPMLQEELWVNRLHLEPTHPLRSVLEELSSSAMAAFDLACTQCQLWKTCKQFLETAERQFHNHLDLKGHQVDFSHVRDDGIQGFPTVLQQISKILNTHKTREQLNAEVPGEKGSSTQFGNSIRDLLLTCFPSLTEECVATQLTLSQKLKQILQKLDAAVNSMELKGSLLSTLMEQATLKPADLEAHPVRNQMKLLLKNLDHHLQATEDLSVRPDYMRSFFDYINTLAAVLVKSLNTDLDQSAEVKIGNPFIILRQTPSQLLSYLMFERQAPPDRISSLLSREGLSLSLQEVIVTSCCEALLLRDEQKNSYMASLHANLSAVIQEEAWHCLPDTVLPTPQTRQEMEGLLTKFPAFGGSSQYCLTPSSLCFLKSHSKLLAAIACLSASRGQKAARLGLSSWKVRREVPLDIEQIVKECEVLLKDFPILEDFLRATLKPLQDYQEENSSLVDSLCGKPCVTLILCGLHSSTALHFVVKAFQQAVAFKSWHRALSILELFGQENGNLINMKDTLLCCAAAEDEEGWYYLFSVHDANLRGTLILCCLDNWPLHACLEVLSYTIGDLGITGQLESDLLLKKQELQLYQKILNLKCPAPWNSCQVLKKESINNPITVMDVILQANEYNLCESWVKLHPVSRELIMRLHQEHLLFLLEQGDSEKAFQLLERISDPDMCLEISLQALDQHPGLAACHFLADYLTTHFYRSLSIVRHYEIQAMRIGSKLLLTLPESARVDYSHLSSSPLLMLEQLLMNMKVDWAAMAVHMLCQLLVGQEAGFTAEDIDNLLSLYAGKALDLPYASRERACSDSGTSLQDFLSRYPGQETFPSSLSSEASTAGTSGNPPLLTSPKDRCQRRVKPPAEFVPPERPPVKKDWVPDGSEGTCMVCKKERFTMFNRRHHCRRCGRLVCNSCSANKMIVEGCRGEPVRVCDQCYIYNHRDEADEELDPDEGIALSFHQCFLIPVAGSPGSGCLDFVEVLQLPRTTELQWKLTLNESENENERSEFYFEQAPSASLCVTILNLHGNNIVCGHQLTEHCRKISQALTNPEVDARLLTDIMKQLLFSAKMMFVKAGQSQDLVLCDSYISKVDMLKILVTANYKYIPSLDQILQPAAITRLRNQLLEAEYYQLAVEVSTKSGLDPGGVWHAWGMACLKAGRLSAAREKFSRCLKTPLDFNQLNLGSRPLQDVIHHLELEVKPILSVCDDDVLASLKELEALLKVEGIGSETKSEGKLQQNSHYQECLYYLYTYGTNLAIISFYMRHDCMREALLHLLNKECPEVFLEGIFMPSYQSGKLHVLENMMETIDSSLTSWSVHLIAACKHLQKRGFFNLLYDLQQFMKDYVRAAMTCIRFFSSKVESYIELGGNQKWLTRAKDHLKTYLQEVSCRNLGRRKLGSAFRKKMSAADVSRHINTIELQIEVTKFLQRCESSGTSRVIGFPLATLFGNNHMKMEVACKVMLGGKNIEEGFGIAFRVIQDFQLEAAAVYNKAVKYLVKQRQYKEIKQLLKCVFESGAAAKNDCDNIILSCIEVADKGPSEAKELDNLILEIKNVDSKIKAYLICSKLRSAYLMAVKQEPGRAVQLVKEVLQVAETTGDGVMEDICRQWLSEHQTKTWAKQSQPSRR